MPLNNGSVLIKLKFPSGPATRSLSQGVSEGIDRPTDPTWRTSGNLTSQETDEQNRIKLNIYELSIVCITENWSLYYHYVFKNVRNIDIVTSAVKNNNCFKIIAHSFLSFLSKKGMLNWYSYLSKSSKISKMLAFFRHQLVLSLTS